MPSTSPRTVAALVGVLVAVLLLGFLALRGSGGDPLGTPLTDADPAIVTAPEPDASAGDSGGSAETPEDPKNIPVGVPQEVDGDTYINDLLANEKFDDIEGQEKVSKNLWSPIKKSDLPRLEGKAPNGFSDEDVKDAWQFAISMGNLFTYWTNFFPHEGKMTDPVLNKTVTIPARQTLVPADFSFFFDYFSPTARARLATMTADETAIVTNETELGRLFTIGTGRVWDYPAVPDPIFWAGKMAPGPESTTRAGQPTINIKFMVTGMMFHTDEDGQRWGEQLIREFDLTIARGVTEEYPWVIDSWKGLPPQVGKPVKY